MMAKPMKTLQLHYPMIQFLIIFYYCITRFVEWEKDCAIFQAARDAWHNWLWVWTITQQVITKQSLNAYNFLGLCGNRRIEQIKVDDGGGVRMCVGGDGWGGCLIYLFVAYSGGYWCLFIIFAVVWWSRILLPISPLQVPHAAEQSIRCFCMNISGSHSEIYNCT